MNWLVPSYVVTLSSFYLQDFTIDAEEAAIDGGGIDAFYQSEVFGDAMFGSPTDWEAASVSPSLATYLFHQWTTVLSSHAALMGRLRSNLRD